MKNSLLTTIVFLSAQMAFSGMSLAQNLAGDTNSLNNNRSWIEGGVYFPEIREDISANLVCIDSSTNEYRYHRKFSIKKCVRKVISTGRIPVILNTSVR
ncbi:MAG: hypothetical protein IPK68_23205 [Bdellovibrionales bacterium]|nr:hypothetical protein [Bdellovibrionales bacterium]